MCIHFCNSITIISQNLNPSQAKRNLNCHEILLKEREKKNKKLTRSKSSFIMNLDFIKNYKIRLIKLDVYCISIQNPMTKIHTQSELQRWRHKHLSTSTALFQFMQTSMFGLPNIQLALGWIYSKRIDTSALTATIINGKGG